MAYAVKWRFQCENYRIDVEKDGYTGDVIERPLGAHPQLRMDEGENIRGTSLEFTAECQVESEFLELYTSSATEFRVRLYDAANEELWSGFVTPEVYSEPDIAPPYDVSILATDGLGELKYIPFEVAGSESPVVWTLDTLLHYLLDKTGETRSINLFSTLIDKGGDEGTPNELLGYYTGVPTWLQEKGKSCYDVLEGIMRSFRAFITEGLGGNWWVVRVTDLEVVDGNNGKKDVIKWYGDEDVDYTEEPVPEFGAMYATRGSSPAVRLSHYPVGFLSTSVVPAKNGVTLKGDTHFMDNILGPLSGWTKTSVTEQTVYGGGFWQIGYLGSMSKALANTPYMSHAAMLVKLVVSGYLTTSTTIRVRVKFWDENSGEFLYWDPENETWESVDHYKDLDITTGRFQRTSDNTSPEKFQEVSMPFNTYDISGLEGYLVLEVANPWGTVMIDCYYAGIVLDEDYKGTERVVTMSNNAREEGGEEEMWFCTYPLLKSSNSFYGPFANALMSGELARSGGSVATNFETDRLPEPAGEDQTLLDCLGRDFALEHFYPRLRKTGTLRASAPFTTSQGWPLFFWSAREQMLYIMEKMSWDLVEEEIEVQMVSMDQTATAEV